jgi:hypothetical protein
MSLSVPPTAWGSSLTGYALSIIEPTYDIWCLISRLSDRYCRARYTQKGVRIRAGAGQMAPDRCLVFRELDTLSDAINKLGLGHACLSSQHRPHPCRPAVVPHKKRTQTLPLSGRWASCAWSVPFSQAASQDCPVLSVPFGHASAGQSYIGGMLTKRQPHVNFL